MDKNLISLFTGAGGLDLGLEIAGFKTVLASELEPHACETLRKNKLLCNLSEGQIEGFIVESLQQRCYKRLNEEERDIFFSRISCHSEKEKYLQHAEVVEGDIRSIPTTKFKEVKEKVGRVFAVAGGPPCQPFSKAGKQKSLDCTKNGDLFYEFVRVVSATKPKWFIFENVKGITFTKTDVVYVVCKECGHRQLAPFKIRQNWKVDITPESHCGKCETSNLDWDVVNEPGGSLKIILNEFEEAGYRCFSKVLNAADFGAPQMRERLFIVGSLEGKDFAWPKETHKPTPTSGSGQGSLFDDDSKVPWVSMYQAIWKDGHPVYGRINKKKAVLWVKNVVRPHDEPVTWHLDRPSPTIGAHQGAKLAFAPKGVPEEQLYRQQWHTLGRRQGDTPPVDVEHRYLTDEELLVLQTFPRWWYLYGTRMQRAFQIGNAVPPVLAKVVGDAVIIAEGKR